MAVRKRACLLVHLILKSDVLKERHRLFLQELFALFVLLGHKNRLRHIIRRIKIAGDYDVVHNGQVGKKPDILESTAYAELRYLIRGHTGDVLTVEDYLARAGRVDAGDIVEYCGLARAVRAD